VNTLFAVDFYSKCTVLITASVVHQGGGHGGNHMHASRHMI